MINLPIAEKYREQNNQAKIFGFILFTDAHPNIIKVLKDDDYWKALNSISEGWIIYSIKPKQGIREFSNPPEGTLGMLISIWKEPIENLKLLELFEIKSTETLPCFVAFCTEGENIKRTVYELDCSSVDNAYNDLNKIISIISKTVDKILPEYKNSNSVYREVKSDIESIITWEKIKKAIKLLSWLKNLLS